MPAMKATIHWPWHGFFEGALAFIGTLLNASQKGEQGQQKALPLQIFLNLNASKLDNVLIELPSEVAFSDAIYVSTSHQLDARRILEQEVNQVDPIAEGSSVRLGGHVNRTTKCIPIICIRKSDLETIEQKARSLKLRSVSLTTVEAPELVVTLPSSRSADHTARKIWAVALLGMMVAFWTLTASITHRLDMELERLLPLEASLQNDLAERRNEERTVSAMQRMAEIGADRMTAGARLSFLARLNSATPSGSRWLSVEMNGQTARLTCVGLSAADARESLTTAFSDARVQFVQAITSESGDLQGFVIELNWDG